MRLFLVISIIYVFSFLEIPVNQVGTTGIISLLVSGVMAGMQDILGLWKLFKELKEI